MRTIAGKAGIDSKTELWLIGFSLAICRVIYYVTVNFLGNQSMKTVRLSLLVTVFFFLAMDSFAVVHVPGYDIVEPQDDDWSCGVNQMTRALVSLGYAANYQELKEVFPRSLQINSKFLGKCEFGPTPFQIEDTLPYLLEYLDSKKTETVKHMSALKAQTKVSFDDLLNFIDAGVPTIALLNLKDGVYFGVNFPNLHYVIPTDYQIEQDEVTTIQFMDSNGVEERVSKSQFLTWWQDWSVNLKNFRMQIIKGVLKYLFWADITADPHLEGGTLIIPEF